jgi:hypothetical protein
MHCRRELDRFTGSIWSCGRVCGVLLKTVATPEASLRDQRQYPIGDLFTTRLFGTVDSRLGSVEGKLRPSAHGNRPAHSGASQPKFTELFD